MPAGTVVVRIIGDSASLQKSLKGVRGKLSGLGAVLSGAALASFGRTAVRAFGDSERAAAEMANTLKNNAQLAGVSITRFTKLASAIQAKTAADDESVLSGAAVLGNFKLTADQIEDVLPLVVDYARKTGRDVPTAATLIGKAMMGNARALKEVGINFKSTGDAGKDFGSITDALRGKVGGFAESEGKTAAGRMEILKNRFNDLQEVVGQRLIGAFDVLQGNLSTLAPVIGGVVAGIAAYKSVVLAATLATEIFKVKAAAAWLVAAGPIGAIVAGVAALTIKLGFFRNSTDASTNALRAWRAAVEKSREAVRNLARAKITQAQAALDLGAAQQSLTTAQREVSRLQKEGVTKGAAYRAAQDAVRQATLGVRSAQLNLSDAIEDTRRKQDEARATAERDRVTRVERVKSIVSEIGASSNAATAGKRLARAWDEIAVAMAKGEIKAEDVTAAIKDLPKNVRMTVEAQVKAALQVRLNVTAVQTYAQRQYARERRAAGGPVTAGRRYLVGERGMEEFVPATSGSIVPNHALRGGRAGNVNVNVTVQGSVVTERQLVDAVHIGLLKVKKRTGALGLA